MSADADTAPGPHGPDTDGRPDLGNSYRDNQQRLDQGMAVMGGIAGDATVIIGAPLDEAVTDRIVKPRLREGPYPADDVHTRLRGFVEPPAYAQCRKVLDSHILVLRTGSGTGASTAAFALLAERYGADGITGLDSPDDLARWRPKEGRGYLLQGLSPVAAASLGEVVLNALAALLRRSGAHLVITVRAETALPGDTVPWQVVHRPPPPADVARKRLNTMVKAGELTPEQSTDALKHLASADFTGYLHAHPLPQDGVEVAEGLRDLVVSGKPAASVLDDLQTGSPAAARKALEDSCHRADSLSLMAAISLLAEQDRTVIEEFSAILRPRLDERDDTAPVTEGSQTRRDVLGPAFEDRLEAVGARLLPPRFGAQRYPVQPVVFSGGHRSDALLRCMWLDYEGMAGLLWKTLDETPHHSGIELAAGQAIGKVLAHATGPDALRQLHPFAASDKRWRRRLVAYALGEMVQYPALTGAVRDQLRQWSRAALVPLRCTVAETCAGSYGLARPAVALKLLDAVLDEQDKDLERRLRTAVSFALSTLLSEDANYTLVLDRLREWQVANPGTQRHALAVHIIESMSLATFPRPSAPGVRRVRLADLLADHPERAFDLVVTALNEPATHEATAAGLSLIESDPGLRHRTAFPNFLSALSGTARSHRGVLRFVLRRHRARTASPAEGFTS
ncbi:hypothetical protein [Streptomyces chryseus]|uniref:Uncharacterized protein n=1 Tax=Streptomyces chryseus TaxID=68186 RepID=A0ABQ3EDB5_9ACTN|nr:hypothetical protein [Streptomyces chryseus]GHB32742.1 hypothetical protein GCM10010346_65000 [Streptomyces chryseus]